MAINGSSFSSISTKQEYTVCFTLQRFPRSITTAIDPPVQPGLVVAYYNDARRMVELFVANELGNRFYKVGA